MKHYRDRYDYYVEIGRYLGVGITSPADLRKYLPPIPELDLRDLRKLDNLQKILEYLERNKN